ncbi:MAG: RluA family pseudouridine synthase [Oscillospiraceae bacterium]|nr:RluA family pseudouridine synthase [Oscillospiraceae bacterium]
MREFVIGKNDSGQRVDKFLSKAVPRLPQPLVYKYLRMKRIKLNGKRCEAADRLSEGDVMNLYVNDEFFEDSKAYPFMFAQAQVNIVYEDENILIADKPAGLIVHEDADEKYDTLINRICRLLSDRGEYQPEKENSFVPALCNRIDRGTCGMVIAAKNAESLRILNEKIRLREIDKRYICIIKGHIKQPKGRLSGYIAKDSENNMVSVTKSRKDGAKTAVTEYKVLKRLEKYDLVEANLITGRTHQIRAQFADVGHPLLGDTKYGKMDGDNKFKNQALCSYKLKFSFPKDSPSAEEHKLLSYLDGKEFTVDTEAFLRKYGVK